MATDYTIASSLPVRDLWMEHDLQLNNGSSTTLASACSSPLPGYRGTLPRHRRQESHDSSHQRDRTTGGSPLPRENREQKANPIEGIARSEQHEHIAHTKGTCKLIAFNSMLLAGNYSTFRCSNELIDPFFYDIEKNWFKSMDRSGSDFVNWILETRYTLDIFLIWNWRLRNTFSRHLIKNKKWLVYTYARTNIQQKC